MSSGGTLATRVTAGTTLSSVTLPGSGSVTLNYDPQPTYALTISNSQTLSGGTLNVAVGGGNATVGAVTFSGSITGAGGLAMSGPGVLNVTSSNSYLGGTTISNGNLIAQNVAALGHGRELDNVRRHAGPANQYVDQRPQYHDQRQRHDPLGRVDVRATPGSRTRWAR